MEDKFFIEYNPRWKLDFDGRQPFIEDEERRSLMEDNIQKTTACGER